MRIIVDAFGGDNAPVEILKGCVQAKAEYDVNILLCGDGAKIRMAAKENQIDIAGMEILQAPDIFEMHDDAAEILKSKADTSLAVGLRSLAEGQGDAFVTAGSTAATVVGATFLVKRIKGIKRCAIATVIPTNAKPYMLTDCGANVDCRPEMLVQFGLMASCYMNKVLKVENPRVGLINIGAEETKGGDERIEAYHKMQDAPFSFIGNVEARELPYGACDVAVADGFTGNIVLKLTEGMAGALTSQIKGIIYKNGLTKLGGLFLKSGMSEFKKAMDYSEYGGAPLLGISRPVIKAHGSSKAKAIKNAVRQAVEFSRTGLIGEIKQKLDMLNNTNDRG